ncbi:hypothetical protein RvY_13027 [Ramazzottius varieornatus]|uniref:VTT domain-containing protein n=1 Tax=Ramazzottius varieornatus TaxID=947166 RepID=A0A1D1VU19_RAMVA|nr:hypothetical protein RvY_13027 [Ramazzottius varieornatus]
MASIVYLPVIFTLCTAGLFLLGKSAPELEAGERLNLQFPKSFTDLKAVTTLLSEYKREHYFYVLCLFCSAFLWKQSFGIPGSASLNLAAGALFGTVVGFPLVCVLTATGATLCYTLSYLFGRKPIAKYFSSKLNWFRAKVQSHSQNLTYYLLFLRLFPASPNWFLNIASPHIGIPVHKFFLTVLLGLMPYNFVCVQSGSILGELESFSDIFTWTRMFQLAMIACVALIPSLYLKKYNKSSVTAKAENSAQTDAKAKISFQTEVYATERSL